MQGIINRQRLRGFTLIELSIVLVILGLLVGGIMGGQALVKNAELRQVINEVNKYKVAVGAFQNKYQALPGDMPNATTYWGQTVAGPTCPSTPSSTQATCNGNGDGKISWDYYEPVLAWKHLSNASLIEGSFSGAFPGEVMVFGVNVPASKWKNGTGYDLSYPYDALFGNNHVIYFSPYTAMIGGAVGVMTPSEAKYIDDKIDDGLARSGNVIAYVFPITDCATSSDEATSTYQLGTTTATCGLVFKMDF